MKTALVKYLLGKENNVERRFIVETLEDMQKLLDNHIITPLHVAGITKYLKNGETIVVNDKGGYSNMGNTWAYAQPEKRFTITWTIDQFAHTPLEAIKKAIEAMPKDNEETLATVFDVEEVDENGKTVNKVQIDILEDEN